MYFSERALASMSTLFLYLEDSRKTAGLFLQSSLEELARNVSVCVCVCVHVATVENRFG